MARASRPSNRTGSTRYKVRWIIPSTCVRISSIHWYETHLLRDDDWTKTVRARRADNAQWKMAFCNCFVSLTHSFSFTDQPNRRETLSDYGNHELTVIYRYSVSGETSSTPSCSVGASGNSRTLLECVILLHSANSSFALLSWTIFYSQVGLLIGLAIFGASLLALRGKHSTNDISEKSTSRQSTPIKGHQTPPRQIKKTAAATGSVHTPAGRRSARIARKKVEHND